METRPWLCVFVMTVGVLAMASTVSSEQTMNSFGDVRCKCICPPNNGTKKNIYIQQLKEPDYCNCMNVVRPLPSNPVEFCQKCDCKWERRNTTTVKVVVIIIICVLSALVLYMLFLLCLDPLMSRRPKTYLEQQNEEDTQSVSHHGMMDESGPRNRNIVSRVSTQVNRVRDEQQKWKGTVQEQRRHIYDRHIMLN